MSGGVHMRILLVDREKITKLTLPEEIDGVFTLEYLPIDSKVTKELSIEAINNQWVLKSNGSINVLENNHVIETCVLTDFLHIKVNINATTNILNLYCMPNIDDNKQRLAVNSNIITIGSTTENSIIYTELANNSTFAIICENNKWQVVVADSQANNPVYLNDKVVKNRAFIWAGDIIFINGLKMIWMVRFIQISSPHGKVSINPRLINKFTESEYDNTKYEAVTEEEQSLELYRPEDYFFHKPTLKEYIEVVKFAIDPPPQKETMPESSFLTTFAASFTMIASAFVSALNVINNIQNGGNKLSIISSTIMCISMIVGSLIIPRIVSAIQKKKKQEKEAFRIQKYSEYLESCEKKIRLIMAKQAQLLRDTNISITECANLVNGYQNLLWNREISDEDFLIVRAGMGNVPAHIEISAPEKHFTLTEDVLMDKIFAVVDSSRILENVPVTFNFCKNRVSAIIDDVIYGKDFVNSVITQLATLHSAQDLKMVFLLNNNDKYDLEYVKYLPHTFSDDKTMRFYAENYDEMKIVSNYLENIFKERKAQQKNKNQDGIVENSQTYKHFDTYYVLITNNILLTKTIPIINMILEENNNIGFSLIILDKNINKLPKRCNSFIALSQDSGCIMEKDLNSQTLFAPEFNSNINLKHIAKALFNIPLMLADIQSTLPTSIDFLQMYNVSRIEQLNINNRWRVNDPSVSLAAPIGVHTSGETFTLDLHEKKAGPHGLIAGSTGSGKSEFIITYILSMCINYHPDEVQFVLIDYKGGGLAGAFENREKGFAIPHLAGTITNLDTASMNRSLVSINSELKRREKMLMDARDATGESTLDIYKYQRYYREGVVKEPMSHLFIISDEFAELKSQQPDFMQELISTARVGRSLGVHLILATQKPSGVVNEQIWSNTKFRVCLKVQTSGDSQEMLKRPDAASIKEAGRFYLQVGYDEYFDIGQSGWAGAKYVPTDRIIKKKDDSLKFINNVGNVTKSVNDFVKKETTKELGDQLTNIVKYLVNLAQKDNFVARKLWLDPIPANIYIQDLALKYNYQATANHINPIIGEYDNPQGQEQGLLTLDLNAGNTYIYGKSGSGKEDLLSTIIYSTAINHSPEEVVFYVVDMGAETLRQFLRYPHVADVCTVDDGDKIIDLMVMIEREISRRKNLTVDFGGNFESYNEMNEKKLPLYVVIINYLDIFIENFSKISELIIPLYRDGSKYGVNFIITANAVSSLRMRTRDYFTNHICLQMANNDDYSNVLNRCPRRLTPASYKGRGLIEKNKSVYEFQSALIYTRNEIPRIVKDTADKIAEKYKDININSIPSIPKIVNVESLVSFTEGLNKIPLGYNVESKDKFFYDFSQNTFNIITANSFDNHSEFLNALIYELKTLENVETKVVDFLGIFDILTIGLTCYQNNFNDIFGQIIEESSKLKKDTLYVITGISKLKANIRENNIRFINQFFIDSTKNSKLHFILVDTYEQLNVLKLESWFQQSINRKYGIWLDANPSSQLLIDFDNISMEDRKINNKDYMFVAINGKRYIVKRVVLVNNGDEEENGQ